MLTIRAPIETERLLLRPFRWEDEPALVALHRPAMTVEQVWDLLDRRLGTTRPAGDGDELAVAVEERASGDLIGEAALRLTDDRAEIVVGVPDPGLADEAAAALVRFGFHRLGVDRVTVRRDPPARSPEGAESARSHGSAEGARLDEPARTVSYRDWMAAHRDEPGELRVERLHRSSARTAELVVRCLWGTVRVGQLVRLTDDAGSVVSGEGDLAVTAIELYERHVPFLDAGRTGRVVLRGPVGRVGAAAFVTPRAGG